MRERAYIEIFTRFKCMILIIEDDTHNRGSLSLSRVILIKEDDRHKTGYFLELRVILYYSASTLSATTRSAKINPFCNNQPILQRFFDVLKISELVDFRNSTHSATT